MRNYVKLWCNSKTQIVMKLRNPNCDKALKKKKNCDETKKLKWWQNSNGDKTQIIKLWQNSKTLIVTKLKNSNCDKSQNYDKTENSICD